MIDVTHSNSYMVLGLFPNIIITSDSERLCFIDLNANNHYVLEVKAIDYEFRGNVIIINTTNASIDQQIGVLIANGVVYRLSNRVIKIWNNQLHSIPTASALENKSFLNALFVVTIVLNRIHELPAFYYPALNGIHCCEFSDAILNMDDIHCIVNQLRGCKKIRILGKDILNHNILNLPELKDIKLETIVDYQYYVSHLDNIANLSRQLDIIVEIKNILTIDNNSLSHLRNNNEKVSVSFCCQVQSIKELDYISDIHTNIITYPSNSISRQFAHFILDYSRKELNQIRVTRSQTILNKVVNTTFYGNVVIDNEGNVNSFPFIDYLKNSHCCISQVIAEIRQNKYWYLTREKFFRKCSNCAFSIICPPLSNFEINSEETFCPF